MEQRLRVENGRDTSSPDWQGKSAAEKNAQRDDIDEEMGEGGGDEEEDRESEDDNEDG